MALRMSSKLLGCFGLSCFLAVATPAEAQSNTVHQLGVLGASDTQLKTGSYFDSYEIEGSEGQRVSISLDSSDFDTFLGLFDSDGNLVASNNDAAADNPNSYISTTLPRNDTYTVVATSNAVQGGGDYRMALRNFSPPRLANTAASGGSWNGLAALLSIPGVQDMAIEAFSSMFSFGGSSASTTSGYDHYYSQPSTTSQPAYGSSVPPIGGNGGLYGNGPQQGTSTVR